MTSRQKIIGLTLSYRDTIYTPRCIQSLLSEGADHILVWDNSDDNGATATALSRLYENEPRVSIRTSPTNLGFSAGVNRGIEWIKERFERAWVLLINNDAYLLPGAIDALVPALDVNRQAVIAYPDIDHNGTVLGTRYYQRHTGLLSSHPLPGSFAYASGCCQLIAVERSDSPIFNEAFFMYGEDWEQGFRLSTNKMIYVPRTLVHHAVGASSGLGSEFYEKRIVRSHWLLTRHLTSKWRERLVLVLGRLVSLPLRAIVRSVRYRSSIPLKALLGSRDSSERLNNG